MTVHYDKGRDRWRYDFELRGERHQGYCLDVKTGALASSRSAALACQEQVRDALRLLGAGTTATRTRRPLCGHYTRSVCAVCYAVVARCAHELAEENLRLQSQLAGARNRGKLQETAEETGP